MLHRVWSRVAVAAACVFAAGSCLPRDVTEPQRSGPAVSLVVRVDAAATAATTVVVEVTGPGIGTPLVFNIAVVDGVATGTITLPAGSGRVITLRAFDAGGVETHRGTVTVAIREGANPAIDIVLIPLSGDTPINGTLGSFVVTIAPTADTLPIGGTATLTATIVDALDNAVLQPVTWAVLDPAVATVASTGDRTAQVTAVGPGTTVVVASFGGSAGSATILVSAPPAVQLVVSGLNLPLYVTQPPADPTRLFVVEQGGTIRVIRDGALLPTAFLDITSLVLFDGGERGLLSMAFHPNYANNGQFFVYYTDRPSGRIQVARYGVTSPDLADASSAQPILTIDHAGFANHYGGLLLFGPDGFLYIGTGDGGGTGDPSGNAQNTGSLLGKILRIDVNGTLPYTVPATNPFVGLPPAREEIWAYGLRNAWRFSFDRLTGDLYIADVGQNAREEIDFQAATSVGGENYGWNRMEGSICYPTTITVCDQTGLVLPIFDYVTYSEGTCSITGGYVYRGTRLPLLRGHYFYGDYCSGYVRSFRYTNGAVTELHDYTLEFGLTPPPLITSFGEDAAGELYIVARGGDVYRIAPATP